MIKLIKKLIERVKMLLDRFIMSSDHDGQKEAGELDMQLTVTSFGVPAQNPFRYKDFEVPEGSYFTNAVLSDSLIPNKFFPTLGLTFISGNVLIRIFVFRIDKTHYRLYSVHQPKSGVSSATVPAHTIRARLKLYIASKSE